MQESRSQDRHVRTEHLHADLRARSARGAILAGGCLFGAGSLISPAGHPVLTVLRELTIFSLAYLTSWVALPGGRRALREVIGLAGDLRPARRATAATRGRPPRAAPRSQSPSHDLARPCRSA